MHKKTRRGLQTAGHLKHWQTWDREDRESEQQEYGARHHTAILLRTHTHTHTPHTYRFTSNTFLRF